LTARTSSNLTQFQSISTTIIGRSKDYPRDSHGAIDKQKIGPDQEFTYTLRIDPDPSSETMDLANVTRMVVTINYDREFIAAKTFETAIPGWNIVGQPQKSLTKNETTVITLEGPKLTTAGQINVLVVEFKGYLPADRAGEDGGRIYNIEITHNIDTYKGNGTAEEVCVPVDPVTHPTVDYDPVCADDLRVLTVTANEFSLGEVTPNPVGVSGTTISFSIGIPLYAELNIYNTNGEVVKQLTAGNMSVGNYDIHLNVDDLPSGVYFYELNAGHFREVKQLVIQK
jgi:hypothetical protein